ncbi:fibrinogen C domain-containing protein 1-like [Patiria miniata]|uniref:Fibrinogen C-terminal domain-containing protein n=1 Tax=Patiria miniata TaxID=46514 RepID=A0A913ZH73_PATMI|nr:fibrinogen C domain-containing protein 1-like [Patiria miniata]
MALRGKKREYLFVVFLILMTSSSKADIPTVVTHVDDEKGTCHYELKIPAQSCKQCKCQPDSLGHVVDELERRLFAVEKQIQQITSLEPPDLDISEYSSTTLSSIIENDDPYASPLFTNEGASVEELLSSSSDQDDLVPLPSNPETRSAATDQGNDLGTPGQAEIKEGFPAINPPGFKGQIEAVPGDEETSTVIELTALEKPLPLYPNQVTDSPPAKEETRSRDMEHFPGKLEGDITGTTEADEGTPPVKGTEKPRGAKLGILSGRSAGDLDSASKASRPSSSVTDVPLFGAGDDSDTVDQKKKPRWKLHDRPSAVHRPPDSRSAPRELLGRAGANCMDGCSCMRVWGYWQDGVYDISNPPGSGKKGESVPAYCDMSTDGGAWTVIQNRQDGSRNFYRQWSSYANGFGQLESDFWLGNNLLHGLTARLPYQLRIEFSDWDDERGYAVYDRFMVGSADDKYRLVLGEYIAGNRGDSLSYHNNSLFSTHDQDNDASTEVNCAQLRQAGFWFLACNQANPNGRYIYREDATGLQGGVITWGSWEGHGFTYALKTFRMMIRPVHYDRILYY